MISGAPMSPTQKKPDTTRSANAATGANATHLDEPGNGERHRSYAESEGHSNDQRKAGQNHDLNVVGYSLTSTAAQKMLRASFRNAGSGDPLINR
jgi:hypothetical protein